MLEGRSGSGAYSSISRSALSAGFMLDTARGWDTTGVKRDLVPPLMNLAF